MKYFKLFFLVYFLAFSLPLAANHLVGGEFRIRYSGNFTYDIQLHVYGDNATLGPGNEDQFVEVSTFNKRTNRLIETFRMNLGGTAFVPYKNLACQTGSITTKILLYQTSKVLQPGIYNSTDGYYITWERCCRNNGVVNIVNPAETGMVFYAEFPQVFKDAAPFINSSPVLPPFPPDYLCTNELYTYSFKSTDPDGDQLVYTLTAPLAGHTTQPPNHLLPGLSAPYAIVDWQNGFSANAQILGNPTLTIDPVSGLLTVRPSFGGLYVFGVKVSEYRNGFKIGETRRDMQVKVNNCPINRTPVITLREPGATTDYVPGDTLVVTDATDFCYSFKFSDPDVGQVLTVKAVPVNFNGNISISPNTAKIEVAGQVYTGQICWPDCNINSPTQLYFADLIVQDNACGNSASDTLRLTFRVIPKKNDKPKIIIQGLDQNMATLNVGEPIKFTVISTDSVDQDELTVTLTGKDFEPEIYDMQFSPVSGKGKVVSTFSWTPDCTNLQRRQEYELKFTVRDNSCFLDHETTVSARLFLKDVIDTAVYIAPNIFTPNDDGINDFFFAPNLPRDYCSDAFQEIQVFSRWGTEVFKSNSRNFNWNGKNVSDGAYYYLIRFDKRKYKGWVEIVR